jgi:hypothetical protein
VIATIAAIETTFEPGTPLRVSATTHDDDDDDDVSSATKTVEGES